MKDTPLIYLVGSWVDPERGQPDLDWLKHKHMAEVVAEPGIHYSDRFWGDLDVALDDPRNPSGAP